MATEDDVDWSVDCPVSATSTAEVMRSEVDPALGCCDWLMVSLSSLS